MEHKQNDLDSKSAGREEVSAKLNNLRINGFLSSLGVASFLGIPFAEIPGRFRDARPLDPHSMSGTISSTRYGAKCPQPIDQPRVERDHLYKGANITISPDSEFSCLCLNIYAPPQALTTLENKKLPVLVWIHGGGWVVGDGNSDYTGEFLVRHSMDIGRPLIYVSINYRLGYFGFLSSRELKSEALALGETGWACQGLQDQRLALKWIQRNIGSFGGDSLQMAIAGESAGAWSVLAHLRSNEPICRNGLILSCPSMDPLSSEMAQQRFDKLVEIVGIPASASAAEKLAALRAVPSERLVELVDGPAMTPAWDDEWYGDVDPGTPFHKFAHFPSWVKGVVIGQTRDEVALFGLPSRYKTKEAATQVVSESCSEDPEFLAELLDSYGIAQATSDRKAVEGLVALASDGVFSHAQYAIGQVSDIPVSVYRFDQEDFEKSSPFYSWSYHALDNAYVCRMPSVAGSEAPASARATANAFSKMFIDMAYGKIPWETYATAGRAMIFDGEETRLAQVKDGFEERMRVLNTDARKILFFQSARKLMRLA